MNRVRFGDLLSEPVRNGVYKKKEFHGRGTKIVNMKELFAYDFISDQPDSLVELTPAELAKSQLRSGDLLFARRSFVLEGAGKCSLVTDPTEALTFESSMIRARPDPAVAHSRFLYYFFKSPPGRARMASIAARTAVSGITGTNLTGLELDLPDINTQRQAASVLQLFDDLIENNRRRIEVLEEMARAIYREWFVKFRYPGHDDVPMVDSALGQIPERWAVASLSTIADITTGQSPKSEFYNDAGIGKPFHQGVADFGSHFPSTRKWCSVGGRSALDGDILVSVRAPVGRINIANTGITIGRGLAALRAKDGRQGLLLGHLREAFAEEDSMGNDGAIFKSLSKSELSSIAVLVPPSDLADAANEVLTDNLAMIRGLAQANRQLSGIRDLLLPKLVTGQIDVSTLDLDLVVEQAA
ncbi:restriction endonuclease subunit S [Micrococcus terreus]|uniref:restriction endonuclease subunit S n=1 Tax=Micrococcus terreus TaxID=574650 RepID=UPI003D762A17